MGQQLGRLQMQGSSSLKCSTLSFLWFSLPSAKPNVLNNTAHADWTVNSLRLVAGEWSDYRSLPSDPWQRLCLHVCRKPCRAQHSQWLALPSHHQLHPHGSLPCRPARDLQSACRLRSRNSHCHTYSGQPGGHCACHCGWNCGRLAGHHPCGHR